MTLHPLLTLCARLSLAGPDLTLLRELCAGPVDWAQIKAQARGHGLAPLLYVHLQAAGVDLPGQLKEQLQSIYLYHSHANRIRTLALAEIVTTCQAAGVRALVLKGGALAHLLYPRPALRPMRDLDLLVPTGAIRQTQAILGDLGFRAARLPAGELPGKHLSVATRQQQNLLISVELHHNLFNIGSPASFTLDDLATAPHPFTLADITAYSLPLEEMLWYLCEHLVLMGQPFRLIWLADIVGLAERFVAEIDWDRLERCYPLVLSTLSLFHFITSLSETLRLTAPFKIGPPPQGIGEEFQGWPSASLHKLRAGGKSYDRILADSFFPSEWWLRLYYGQGSVRSIFWLRWLRHPAHILGWLGQLCYERIRVMGATRQ